jgi:hypothetical protein
MTAQKRTITHKRPRAFTGFTIPDVALLPPEFFDLLPNMKASAELKVTLVSLRLSLSLGMQDIPYSLRDFEQATGLDRKGVLRGIRAGVQRGTLSRVPFGKSFIYRLRFRDPETSDGGILPPHACMHTTSTTDMDAKQHAEPKQAQLLKDIIALGVATRVALAMIDKRDAADLKRHIEYTRYAVEHHIARAPAAWFVSSVRDNWGPPLGFGQKKKPRTWWDPKYDEFINR